MDVVVLMLVAAGTALATGLGALPVVWLGRRVAVLTPLLWGVAGGVMAIAAVVGLLLPAFDRGGAAEALAGVAAGAAGFVAARSALEHRRHVHLGTLEAADARRGVLVVGTLFVHSLPEGLAVGAAWATEGAIGLFVVLAIAIQNVPEGLVTALPLREGGVSPWRTFWTAVGTSVPQVPGALLAYAAVTTVERLLGFSFGLAAGAMLALVVLEVIPATASDRRGGVAGALVGAAAMGVMAVLIGA